MAHTRVNVNLGDRSYPIYIGEGLIDQIAQLIPMEKVSQILVVSNETVFPLYGQAVCESLETLKYPVHIHQVKDGEIAKSWDVAYEILDLCVYKGLDRSSLILALGGGVVGDLAGFVAAISPAMQYLHKCLLVHTIVLQCLPHHLKEDDLDPP
jgi:3-dehydroquinate synthase